MVFGGLRFWVVLRGFVGFLVLRLGCIFGRLVCLFRAVSVLSCVVDMGG